MTPRFREEAVAVYEDDDEEMTVAKTPRGRVGLTTSMFVTIAS